MKEMLETLVSYLATATLDAKPNVVPVGFVHALSESEVLIVDVSFNESQIDQNIFHVGIQFEHEKIVGGMDIEIVENFQGFQNVFHAAFAVEIF